MKRKSRFLSACFLSMLIVSMVIVTIITVVDVALAPSTIIYVSQALITIPPANPAGFPIDVNVTDAPTTWAWEVSLTWDPNLLELFFDQEGEFLHRGPVGGPGLYDTEFTLYPTTYAAANVKGQIMVGCTLKEDPYNPPPWATGNGRLFRLGFRVKTAATGSTLIDLFDTVLVDHIWEGSPAPTLHPNRDSFFRNVEASHDVSGRARYIKPLNMSGPRALVYEGEMAAINVTVLNEGTVSESITLNVKANGTLIGTTSLLLNGELGLWGSFENRSRTYTVKWDTTGFAHGKYNITASVPAVTGEVDTADNNFMGELQVEVLPIGDINFDGYVDSEDLILLSQVYGCTSASSNWNKNADLNKDNIINVADVFLMGRKYEETI